MLGMIGVHQEEIFFVHRRDCKEKKETSPGFEFRVSLKQIVNLENLRKIARVFL